MNETRKTKQVLRGAAAAGLASVLALGMAGCKSKDATAPIVSGSQAENGQDPALANMAQPYTGGTAGGYAANGQPAGQTQVMGASQSYSPQESGESYSDQEQAAAPIVRQAPGGSDYGGGYTDTEEAGEQALAATDQAPPPLPQYDQPPAPDPNYLWTPGYWNYGPVGYYWVPGVWCAPPFYGALWTPPYWGLYGGRYLFHRGYWGPHVGFYGGVDYGFGYVGFGYFGGYWRGHDFLYNRAVTNVGPGFNNVYNRAVFYNGRQYGPHPSNRVDFDGGHGGLNVQPRPSELAAAHEAHYAPVAAQRDVRVAAAANHGQAFTANGGHPAEAFSSRPAGSTAGIASAPREQPFNNRTAAANPAARPNTEANRPGGEANRPGSTGNPALAGGSNVARPGAETGRPATPGNTNSRVGAEANRSPAAAARPTGPVSRPAASSARAVAPATRSAAPVSRQPAPVTREAAPVERQAAPVTRQAAPAARPEAAPAARPAETPHAAAPAPGPLRRHIPLQHRMVAVAITVDTTRNEKARCEGGPSFC